MLMFTVRKVTYYTKFDKIQISVISKIVVMFAIFIDSVTFLIAHLTSNYWVVVGNLVS